MSKGTFRLSDLDSSFLVKLDEEIRDQVRAPTFPLHSRIYRRIRRARSYHRIYKNRQYPRRPVPITGQPVNVSEALEIGRRLGISPREMERHVEYVKVGVSANARVFRTALPIEPDERYAYLFGLFHACGCINYRERDPMIRFAVDSGVVPTLQKLGAEIGEVPHVHWNQLSRMNGKVWARKRVYVGFSFILKDVLERFGLYTGHGARRGMGRWRSARELSANIPWWIVKSPTNMHAYVEGYLNTMKTQVVAHRTRRKGHASGYILVNFSGIDQASVKIRAGLVKTYMESRGITVHWRVSTRDPGRLPEAKLGVYSKDALRQFQKVFKIDAIYVSTKLRLVARSSHTEMKVLQSITSTTDASVLGLVMDRPRTVEEIHSVLRMREDKLQRAIRRLSEACLLRKSQSGLLSFDRIGFAKSTAKKLDKRHRLMMKALADASSKLFYRCAKCSAITEKASHCGLRTEPVQRMKVLRPILHSAILGKRSSNLLIAEANAR